MNRELKVCRENVFASYKEILSNYTDMPSYTNRYHDLEKKLQEQVELLHATNIQQLKLACQEVLVNSDILAASLHF
jgi:hypothetical protein